jgi:hypothetical protein
MSDASAFPYATHLNILFPALSLVDVPGLVSQVKDQWYNQTLCKVNDSVVRLGVMQGEYHWHKHDDDDEFFFVLDGHFIIDLTRTRFWCGAATWRRLVCPQPPAARRGAV